MRYIVVKPNEINDSYVHSIGKMRLEFMSNARVLNIDNECEPMQVIDFSDDYYDSFNEKVTLDGSWVSVQHFNEDVLPDIRKTVTSLIRDKEKDIFHIDLGKSLITLYVAYFAILEGVAVNVSYHAPNPDDEQPTFNIGGDSAYSNPRNNLRRYISSQIMNKAMTIFVDDPRVVPILNRLFPRINREIHIDPMIQIEESEG
jgi:hypothetical protein